MTTALPYRLDRTMVIHARPETVFAFLNETPRWAAWWGPGSSIDPRPGGPVVIRHANGVEASGEVIEVRPPSRLVFTYGYVELKPSPPGSSRVTIRLDPHPRGTLLQLTHEFADEPARDEHVQGWRFQLSVFANVIADSATGDAAAIVDGWFLAWNEPDAERRRERLARVAAPDIRFTDRFSTLDGLEDLIAHVAACHRFMPGAHLTRRGEARHCQWRLLADWVALGEGGKEIGAGTSVFALNAGGAITSATGFWNAPRR
jgi:uncharacterized protein YndB with AHSA1/START domain